MAQRIEQVEVFTRVLDPAESEAWLVVQPARPVPDLSVRGRLVGPSSPYSSTIEVSYRLLPLRGEAPRKDALTMRAVIPDASFWEPGRPFLYRGAVELWSGDRLCDTAETAHGFRVARIDQGRLLWNGQPLVVRGKAASRLDLGDAERLADQGFNAVLADWTTGWPELVRTTDRYGLLLLLRVGGEVVPAGARRLVHHPSFLGWVVGARGERLPGTCGRELRQLDDLRDASDAAFLLGPEATLAAAATVVPRLILVESVEHGAGVEGAAGVIGWVARTGR